MKYFAIFGMLTVFTRGTVSVVLADLVGSGNLLNGSALLAPLRFGDMIPLPGSSGAVDISDKDERGLFGGSKKPCLTANWKSFISRNLHSNFVPL
jgi:hypothetical protein